MTVITRTPVKWEGTYPDMAIKQGWNEPEKKFWIQVTNRKNGITNRIYMDEEFYHNFHNMGNYIFKQHSIKDPDTEFCFNGGTVKEGELPQTAEPGTFKVGNTVFEIKDDPRPEDYSECGCEDDKEHEETCEAKKDEM